MPSSYAIGSYFEGFIKQQLESGRYASASEVIREALRLLEEREEERKLQLKTLREQLQAGVESGSGIPAEKVFARLEKKYSRQTAGD
jgi:antitoxin ParD1/3/4